MLNSLLAYSIANGITLLAVLVYKNISLRSARYFLLLYLLFIVSIAEQLYITPIIFHTSWYSYPDFPIRFIFLPLLFLYINNFLNPDFRLTPRLRFILFAPMTIDLACFMGISGYVYASGLTMEQRIEFIDQRGFYLLRTGLSIIFSLLLNVSVLKTIQRFVHKLKEVYADDRKLQIRWLYYLAISTMTLFIAWFGYYIAEIFINLPRELYLPLFLLFGVNIIIAGYFAVLQPDTAFIFKSINQEISGKEATEINAASEIEEENFRETNPDKLLKELFFKIELSMEKVYSNNDLSLSLIAADLKVSPHLISKAIRAVANINFYGYVNYFRVRKLLEKMTEEENSVFTIHVLAQKCGFNSKTTLQKYFRECIGMTPSEALKKIKAGEETIESLLLSQQLNA